MEGNAATLKSLEVVFGSVVQSVLALVGAISVVMLAYGFFLYLTAGDNKEGAGRASGTIQASVVGLIVSLSAWMGLSLIGSFLGVGDAITIFNLCLPNQSC